MYGFSLKGKIISVLSVVLLMSFAVIVKQWGYRAIFFTLAIIMFRDVLSVMTARYYLTDRALHFKDVFKDKAIVTWQALEYITITKKNKKWIALVYPEGIHYLKRDITDVDGLLKAIVAKARNNKALAIHDSINETYQLGLKLNDQGKIKH